MPPTLRHADSQGTQIVDVSGRPMLFTRAGADLWLSHRAVADLLQTTTQNVVMHLRDLRLTGAAPVECLLPSERVEGSRTVRRRIKQVSLATAAAIALRARRFTEHDALLAFARSQGVTVSEVRINAVKERNFGELLLGILAGITPVQPQYRVGRYRIDFYLPEIRLAVEYDELHHDTPIRTKADVRRQEDIVSRRGLRFLRIKQGAEIEGLNTVVRLLARRGSGASSR